MASRSVLIIGGNGFVGINVARALSRDHQVHCTHQGAYTPVPGVQFHRLNQIGDKNVCKVLVNKIEPEVVVYCAGNNELFAAEQNLPKTQLAHSAGVTNIFATSDTFKSKFIYLSTDFVFSGVDGNYNESSTAIPAFQLGKAKLGAENFLRSRSLNFIIIRAAPLIGRGPLEHPSLVDQLREAALLKKRIRLPAKMMHNPVHIDFLNHAISHVILQDVRNKYLHIGGLTKISMAELGKSILTRLELDPETVEVSDAASTALPSDYSLNFTETLKYLDTEPWDLNDSLKMLDPA